MIGVAGSIRGTFTFCLLFLFCLSFSFYKNSKETNGEGEGRRTSPIVAHFFITAKAGEENGISDFSLTVFKLHFLVERKRKPL